MVIEEEDRDGGHGPRPGLAPAHARAILARGDEVLAGTLDHARAIARRSVLVADSGKFGRGSYVQVASHSAVPDVVSDDRLAPRWVAQIAESGTWLHAALVARSE